MFNFAVEVWSQAKFCYFTFMKNNLMIKQGVAAIVCIKSLKISLFIGTLTHQDATNFYC